MKITHTMVVMFVGSLLIQYFLMPPIMVNSRIYITNNIGKAYMAVIMALFMVLLEVMMHDHQYHVLSLNLYAIIFAALALFIYLYRKQVAINDKQYLEGMIEHHSMALLTSEEILQKTQSERIKKLAENIISTQEKEIEYMRQLIAING